MNIDNFQPSEAQRVVLRWVLDGRPAEMQGDKGHKMAARALERLGLLNIVGPDWRWVAFLTSRGREWVAANRGLLTLPDHMEAMLRPRLQPQPYRAEAAALLASVQASEGVLWIDRSADRSPYRAWIDASHSLNERPFGQCLEFWYPGLYGGRLAAVILTPQWEETEHLLLEGTPSEPLSMSQSKSDLALGVRHYLDHSDNHWVSPQAVERAARILQAIHEEATAREWKPTYPNYDKGDLPTFIRVHIRLSLPSGRTDVHIREVPAAGARAMKWEEYSSPDLPQWMRDRRHTFRPTGKLELTWGSETFRDGKTLPLERRLPQVFRAAVVADKLQKLEKDEQRRRGSLIKQHMSKLQHLVMKANSESKDWEHFESQYKKWQGIRQRRKFLAELERAAEHTPPGADHDERSDWLQRISRRLDIEDPVKNPGPIPRLKLASEQEVNEFARSGL